MSTKRTYKKGFINLYPQQRQDCLYIYTSWHQAVRPYHHPELIIPTPQALTSETELIGIHTLPAFIAIWIQQNRDWRQKWEAVLARVPVLSFLQQGYKGTVPDLFWLFNPKMGGNWWRWTGPSKRGIDKVLEGRYDCYRPKPTDDEIRWVLTKELK